MTVGAIIVAAGNSTRMGGVDKLLASLGGRPVLSHSIVTFAEHPSVDQICIVVSEANREAISRLRDELAPAAIIVLGGPRRRDSVLEGLEALPDTEHVLVHDGARPLVTPELIGAALAGAIEHGAALCAVEVADTVKRAGPDGMVASTVRREGLWLAQTPQGFHSGLLRMAHGYSDIDATDDCALVELMGAPVKIVQGSARNLKLTTPADLRLAEALLAHTRDGSTTEKTS